jgi:phosphate/sulfate permease
MILYAALSMQSSDFCSPVVRYTCSSHTSHIGGEHGAVAMEQDFRKSNGSVDHSVVISFFSSPPLVGFVVGMLVAKLFTALLESFTQDQWSI